MTKSGKREVGRWRQHTGEEECSGGNHSGSSLHSWEVTKSWQAVGLLPGTSQGPSVPSQFPPSSFHTASWGAVGDTEQGMLQCLWITQDCDHTLPGNGSQGLQGWGLSSSFPRQICSSSLYPIFMVVPGQGILCSGHLFWSLWLLSHLTAGEG